MSRPTLCMISETVGPHNAIGKIAAAEVRAALAADYRVTVVAHRLDEELRSRVEWLKLYNPPRGFALKWLTARHFVKRALGGRRFDVVHGHQPQIADLCDVFQCHFLTRVAAERGCLVSGSGLGASLRRKQQEAIMRCEDRCYRRWNPNTRLLFVSELIQREFERLYGLPDRCEVFENAAPAWDPVDESEREAAKHHFAIQAEHRPVLGYLGGLQRRKGYEPLVDAVATEPELFLLMAGQQSDGFTDSRLAGRVKGVGLTEPRRFLAACDVVAVPSVFDPCPMIVLEAVSRGIPVIASEGVGNRASLLEFGAGLGWEYGQPIGPVVRSIMNQRDRFTRGCRALVQQRSETAKMRALLHIYDEVAKGPTDEKAGKLQSVDPKSAAATAPATTATEVRM